MLLLYIYFMPFNTSILRLYYRYSIDLIIAGPIAWAMDASLNRAPDH